jgi:hypothetical protein
MLAWESRSSAVEFMSTPMRFIRSSCCARDKRPDDRRPAEKRDELAPLHVPPKNKPAARPPYHFANVRDREIEPCSAFIKSGGCPGWADLKPRTHFYVRSTLNSGHRHVAPACPVRANSGLMHRSN